jgi:hypothetical protein
MIHRNAIVLVVLPALAGVAHGEPLIRIDNPPISTVYTDTDPNAPVELNTHVTQITVDVIKDDTCLDAHQVSRVRGTISGVGQGGVTFALNASKQLVDRNVGLEKKYKYTVKYEYLMPKVGVRAGRMLVVNFPGPRGLVAGLNRAAFGVTYRNGQRFLARPALLDHGGYFVANHLVRVPDPEDPELNDTVNDAVCHYLDGQGPVYDSDDLVNAVKHAYPWLPEVGVGKPLPCTTANDAATVRDVTRAGKYIHELLMGAPPRYTIGWGISASALPLVQIISGRSADETSSEPPLKGGRRSGGNYLVPYDPTSGVILDYAITRGLPFDPGSYWNVDPEFPVSAPTVMLIGNADPRVTHVWRYLADVADAPAGVTLNDWFRYYEWRETPHRWGTDESTTVCGVSDSDLGPMGPWVSALYENARTRLDKGQPEPQSRFAGHLDGAGQLVFERTASDSHDVPFVDDPPGDKLLFVTPQPPSSDQVADWKRIDALLPHGTAITPPLLACRLGHYTITEGGGPGVTLPKLAPDLLGSWTFDSFLDCLDDAIQALHAEGFYDPRVESAPTTAARFRPLFFGAPKAKP